MLDAWTCVAIPEVGPPVGRNCEPNIGCISGTFVCSEWIAHLVTDSLQSEVKGESEQIICAKRFAHPSHAANRYRRFTVRVRIGIGIRIGAGAAGAPGAAGAAGAGAVGA